MYAVLGDERREEDSEGYVPVRPSKYFKNEPDLAFGALVFKQVSGA